MSNTITTIEADCGLWLVYQGGQQIGVIWMPEREAFVMGDKTLAQCDDPKYVALDDWVDGCLPGNPIEGCATWHQALKAVVAYSKQASPRFESQPKEIRRARLWSGFDCYIGIVETETERFYVASPSGYRMTWAFLDYASVRDDYLSEGDKTQNR